MVGLCNFIDNSDSILLLEHWLQNIREDKCNPATPKCYDKCSDKTPHSITKPIGFLSEGEYLNQKIIKKITPKDHNEDCSIKCKYELPLVPASNNTLIC